MLHSSMRPAPSHIPLIPAACSGLAFGCRGSRWCPTLASSYRVVLVGREHGPAGYSSTLFGMPTKMTDRRPFGPIRTCSSRFMISSARYSRRPIRGPAITLGNGEVDRVNLGEAGRNTITLGEGAGDEVN